MWESQSVHVNVRLPEHLAAEVEEVQKNDPEFLSRVVRYGLTRRSVYRHLRKTVEDHDGRSPVGAEVPG